MTKKSKKQRLDTISADHLEIEFKVACEVIESINFAELHEFCKLQATLNTIPGRSADCIYRV